MPDFVVRYQPERSPVQQKQLQAADRQALAGLLGVSPQRILSVQELSPAVATRAVGRRFPLQLFSQELSVLLGSSVSLVEALETLSEKEAHGRYPTAWTTGASRSASTQPLRQHRRGAPSRTGPWCIGS